MNNPFDLIEARLNTIETLLLDLKHQLQEKQPAAEPDRWFNLNELCQYHPDKPCKHTVYGWVQAGTIPVHKGGKRLRFLKSEIDTWLKQGRKKTWEETDSEAETYLKKKTIFQYPPALKKTILEYPSEHGSPF